MEGVETRRSLSSSVVVANFDCCHGKGEEANAAELEDIDDEMMISPMSCEYCDHWHCERRVSRS